MLYAGSSDGATAGSAAASPSASAAPQPTLPEEQQKTGEEDENVLYASEGTLFQFVEESKSWKERGRGELRVNKGRNGEILPSATAI